MSKKMCVGRDFFVWLLFIGIILSLSGCGLRDLASGKITPPEVTFQGLMVYPPESQCWPLTARLRLTNPNPEPLRILGYDYELAVEGTELVQGESSTAITLPAGGESLVEVPMLLRLNTVPTVLRAFFLQDSLKYELSGGVRLGSLLGGLRVPFRFRGVITRQEGLERLSEFLRLQR